MSWLVPDLVTRFTLPPGLRPTSADDCVCRLNSAIESIGSVTPAMFSTPPWFTAGMLCHQSLLSAPSICQFTWLPRVPFTEPKPPSE